MHRPHIIANWKMNTNLADATLITTTVKNSVAHLDLEVTLCPPSIWLYPVTEVLNTGSKAPNLHLGAQNMWFTESGAVTGEISPGMIKKLAKYVIIGHSERRNLFKETDELINDKVISALKHDLIPVICVGELRKMQEEKRSPGRPAKVDLRSDIFNQLRTSLQGVSTVDIEKLIIAYEPVWAIGTGHAATGGYANEVTERLRDVIAEKYNRSIAERVKILYGGSVDEDNIAEFIHQPQINGALVGGASLNAKRFVKICQEAVK